MPRLQTLDCFLYIRPETLYCFIKHRPAPRNQNDLQHMGNIEIPPAEEARIRVKYNILFCIDFRGLSIIGKIRTSSHNGHEIRHWGS